ncbi:hypothetical protein FC89_GL002264 [Liquorilactobacillus ghanensis DSM 18630]|uniref:Uncharacterized protein n=1 Tax=Liquorilactobacillus ghanensis DSM 18630 TaxID=1423750 RepID=A0A0R1VG00_9LACO|nr:hypothetical protein [Liquorilactobacillus ghanensis]KRM04576.1 hypothetical protein FC89_GL002264 [Liquorilactobacillus ghanensis DSM 18630]
MSFFRKSKTFWTLLSFLTFLLFVLAIGFKIYWINIFVIAFGILINKFGIDKVNKNYKFERKD